jgi:hypothetical protein
MKNEAQTQEQKMLKTEIENCVQVHDRLQVLGFFTFSIHFLKLRGQNFGKRLFFAVRPHLDFRLVPPK